MADRKGVEIDCCPKCRGVWFERGELNKIIERNSMYDQGFRRDSYSDQKHDSYGGDSYFKNNPHYTHKKRKGFLGELFNFD
ncbi:MAG: zf-TFIIB domain-containing protein [Flavisolibacter sp.]|nr:zf-TFIIB domain-containing protein [Flavisolibacter sp.]